MSEERNVAIEVSLNSLDNQIEVFELMFENALGKDQTDQGEKPELAYRPIGTLIERLPRDIDELTSRLKSLITTFDEIFISGASIEFAEAKTTTGKSIVVPER